MEGTRQKHPMVTASHSEWLFRRHFLPLRTRLLMELFHFPYSHIPLLGYKRETSSPLFEGATSLRSFCPVPISQHLTSTRLLLWPDFFSWWHLDQMSWVVGAGTVCIWEMVGGSIWGQTSRTLFLVCPPPGMRGSFCLGSKWPLPTAVHVSPLPCQKILPVSLLFPWFFQGGSCGKEPVYRSEMEPSILIFGL